MPTERRRAKRRPAWPKLEDQLAASKAIHGSALERLIKDNQEFHLLSPEERDDELDLPPWLRVFWRKRHPEGTYSAHDATGGYPLVLHEIYESMLADQEWPGTEGFLSRYPASRGPRTPGQTRRPRGARGTGRQS